MAISAVLSVVESSVRAKQPAFFTLVISNSGGDDVTVLRATPIVPNGSPSLFSGPTLGGTVAAAGTLTLDFQGVFFANAVPVVLDSDTDQTTVPVYVAITTELSDAQANVVSSTVNMQISPIAYPSLLMPGFGQLRFDSNNNSALFPVVL
jgi:hypothetical protein